MQSIHPLAAWRNANRMTQVALAEKLGSTRWTINSIETGRRRPSFALADAINRVTDGEVTANDFLAVTAPAPERIAS